MTPRLITAKERMARRVGRVSLRSPLPLGTAIKHVTTALGIKQCGGCKKRQVALDAIIPNINPLAR